MKYVFMYTGWLQEIRVNVYRVAIENTCLFLYRVDIGNTCLCIQGGYRKYVFMYTG